MRYVYSTVLLLSAAMLVGCGELYDAPPAPFIEGAEDGLLDDASVPVVLSFGEAVDPTTIHVKVVRAVTDIEGNLADEDADPATELDVFFISHPVDGDVGGVGELIEGNTKLRIVLKAPLPVGPKLALLVEKGLADVAGHETTTRKRLGFGYSANLECNAPSAVFGSGYYFMLADILEPLATQVQLWAYYDVDPMTGAVHGQCTNADRIKDPNRCPMACTDGKVCRLLPQPECVLPSTKAGTVDEYSDYVPNPTPPTGYTFPIEGCVQDQPDGTVAFVTAPTDVVVQSPAVTLRNVTLNASFGKDAMGVLRGAGSLVSDQVLIGTTASGKGKGGLDARKVPTDEVPKDVPLPEP